MWQVEKLGHTTAGPEFTLGAHTVPSQHRGFDWPRGPMGSPDVEPALAGLTLLLLMPLLERTKDPSQHYHPPPHPEPACKKSLYTIALHGDRTSLSF